MNASTVTKILGAVLLLDLAILGGLAVLERPTPDILELLASSALAGLLGLLAPSPRVQTLEANAPALEALIAERRATTTGRHAGATTTPEE